MGDVGGAPPLGDPYPWLTFCLGNLSHRFSDSQENRESGFLTLGFLERGLPSPRAGTDDYPACP